MRKKGHAIVWPFFVFREKKIVKYDIRLWVLLGQKDK